MKVNRYFIGVLFSLWMVANGYGADWCVQVSTFRHMEGIKQDFQRVKTHSDARIEKIEGIYSLRIGYFDTEARAKGELKTIKDEFPNAFVRKCANEPDRVIESSPSRKRQDRKSSEGTADRVTGKPAGTPVGKPVEKSEETFKQPPAPSLPAGRPRQSPPVSTPQAMAAKAVVPPAATKGPEPGPAALKHTRTSPVPPPPAAPAALPSAPVVPTAPATPKATAPPSVFPPQETSSPAPTAEPSDPQRLYDEAERHRGSGNYTLAIDLYKKVIQHSIPESVLAGRASYRAALCYDIIGEKKASETGYAQAIEKWPGLDIAPAEILFAGGMKAYHDRKYDGALKIFSLHRTAYPADVRRTEYMMACTLLQQARYHPAMFFFSRMIEKYPDSHEATEAMVAFGNMGMAMPKIRATMFSRGWEWFRDPIHAYDTALRRYKDWSAVEHILYAKGNALTILGRHEEAQKTLFKCLKVYPSSTKAKLYKASVGANLPPLVKLYYDREDYAGVVSAYFQASGNDVPLPVDAATVIMIGRSLYRIGLNEDASNFLKAARIKANGVDAEQIGRALEELGKSFAGFVSPRCDDTLKEYRDLQSAGHPIAPGLAVRSADCLFMSRQHEDSISIYQWALGNALTMDERRWALLRMGQANLKLGKADIAKKTFDELKATGADEFWSKLADFTYDDGKWTEKFNRVTKKK